MKTSLKKSKLVSSAFVCAALAYGCSASPRTTGTTQGVADKRAAAGPEANAKGSATNPTGGEASSQAGAGGAAANAPGVPGKVRTAGGPGAREAGAPASLEAADKKLKALPPGGSFDTRAPNGCTYRNGTARVVLLSGNADGSYLDIPPSLKEQIKQILTREISRTNFRFSSIVDGTAADTVTAAGVGVAGTISVGMYKGIYDGFQRHGGAGMGASEVTQDGLCDGTAWGTIGFREGQFDESTLLHELGHALGLKHNATFDWRHRPLMPAAVNMIAHYGLVYLGSPDSGSIMGSGINAFSEGDIRTLNYLYPVAGGTPRSLQNLKPGTEIETGLAFVRGLDEPTLKLTTDYDAQATTSAKGLTWRTAISDDYNFSAQATATCRADVVLGQPCSVRGFTCSTRQGIGYDGAGRICAGDGDVL